MACNWNSWRIIRLNFLFYFPLFSFSIRFQFHYTLFLSSPLSSTLFCIIVTTIPSCLTISHQLNCFACLLFPSMQHDHNTNSHFISALWSFFYNCFNMLSIVKAMPTLPLPLRLSIVAWLCRFGLLPTCALPYLTNPHSALPVSLALKINHTNLMSFCKYQLQISAAIPVGFKKLEQDG